jgi:hypothetical protein
MKNIIIMLFFLSSTNLVLAQDKAAPVTSPAITTAPSATAKVPVMAPPPAVREFIIELTEKGFQPDKFDLSPASSVSIKFSRRSEKACGTSVIMAAKKIKKMVPLNETVTLDLGKLSVGEHVMTCGTSKFTATFLVK